jgi:hypothetical protein
MTLPKRPGPYILTLLLVILIVLVMGLFKMVSMPEWSQLRQSKEAKSTPSKKDSLPSLPNPGSSEAAPVLIDPMLQARADQLHEADQPPERDLEIIAEFLQTYGRARGGNPIGGNTEITAALTGADGHQGRVFPPIHRTIKNGQLTDRWGTPYWFHPNSGSEMEIRSAGPDKELFTLDDVVINPSPSGLGATPVESPPLPK